MPSYSRSHLPQVRRAKQTVARQPSNKKAQRNFTSIPDKETITKNTSQEAIDPQAFTVTSKPSEAPFPWTRLPTELKLMVLDLCLRIANPITHRTHDIHSRMSGLPDILVVNKEMCELAKKVYCSNGFRIEHPGCQSSGDTRHSYFKYPKPFFTSVMTKMELKLRVPVGFNLVRFTRELCPGVLRYNEWRILLTPRDLSTAIPDAYSDYKSNGQIVWPPSGTRYDDTDWQVALLNLNYVKIVLVMEEKRVHRYSPPVACLKGKKDSRMKKFFRSTSVIMRPKELDVVVDNLVCGSYCTGVRGDEAVACQHRCAEKIAKAVEALIVPGDGKDPTDEVEADAAVGDESDDEDTEEDVHELIMKPLTII